jgi:hypothetical protein
MTRQLGLDPITPTSHHQHHTTTSHTTKGFPTIRITRKSPPPFPCKVEALAKKFMKRNSQKGFLYAMHKQEYLELIERQETQKAFTYLTSNLKVCDSNFNSHNQRLRTH